MIEKLAALAHKQWSGWMEYLFKFGTENPDGSFTMNADKVARWRRQMSTAYADLPESEKESDRTEAWKMLAVVRQDLELLSEAVRPTPDLSKPQVRSGPRVIED